MSGYLNVIPTLLRNRVKLALNIFLCILFTCKVSYGQEPVANHDIPAGKGIVYFYRSSDETFGRMRTYDIFINGAKTSELSIGGTFQFVANPGPLVATADTHFNVFMVVPLIGAAAEAANKYSPATVHLKIVKGRILYVRFHPVAHPFSYEPTLTVVPEDTATKELAGLK